MIIYLYILLQVFFVNNAITVEKYIQEKKFVSLEELEIQDTNLFAIIDSFLLTNSVHKNDYLLIDICNHNWNVNTTCVIEDTMIVRIELVTKNRFLDDKIGFFKYHNIFGSVSGVLIPSIFKRTGRKKTFRYEQEKTNPFFYSCVDNNLPWFYYHINNKFFKLDW